MASGGRRWTPGAVICPKDRALLAAWTPGGIHPGGASTWGGIRPLARRTLKHPSPPRRPAAPSQAIAAHDTWLAYLSELWAVLRRRGGAIGGAARHQYARLLHASLADPAVLSRHAASLGARFRCAELKRR
jgi:hypothetical protein